MENKSAREQFRSAFFVKLRESLISVVPVTLIVLILTLTPLVEVTAMEIVSFVVCAIFLILGISLFNLGADLAMTPMGQNVGEGLTKSKKLLVLLGVCFLMGVLITIAEPDLSVLAGQVSSVINSMTLIITVGIGVGIFLLLAVLKIVFKRDLSMILLFFYMIVFAFCALLLETGHGSFLSLCFDSGGVTTGPITVPFIMALGVGIAMTIGGKKANENSFGLIAMCSVGPILMVMILSICSSGSPTYTVDPSTYQVSSYLGSNFLPLLGEKMHEVGRSLLLIVIFFFVLQFLILKLPKRKIIQIIVGIVYTFLGLVIFLTAVTIGFMPIGFKIGQSLAHSSKVFLVIFAFVIGMVVVLAEPAVHVLNAQVEDVTNGAVSKREMMLALSIGVGISIGLSVIRIIFGFSLLFYLIPGYLISLGLSFFVPKLYTSIAFDSGGVASGPLTSSFILPMAMGACSILQGENEILNLAFGVVAMVAMTPLITIQSLGFKSVMQEKRRSRIARRRILSKEDEQIIYFK